MSEDVEKTTVPPAIRFPAELPICAYREEIEKAIRENQVVIVCGDTGSGKTTQLPKMALELGRGSRGRRIACTQPRRLAAVTVANRVAEEFGAPAGGLVGYQHRFERKVSRETRIKFMTDGVLLAETRADPLLRAYDTIIIDEAHERSLNIDFLLGILKRILARRRDLKVIVSSATLDSDLFSRFFGNAPALHVPGRLYPISIRYLAPPEDEESDVARDVADAVEGLPADGDILVFLSGERDIREAADALDRRSKTDDIIPLMASLPAGEQQRAFHLSSRRRIILATNVAETSVTIPGIRYVIDSGLARISRYIHRTQVQRLQIEPISQASANQRAGRCGRLGPGICIRLYSQEDFDRREPYTAPEILRSSLAGVILTMLDLKLGDIAEFPFLNPPEPAMIREGIRELMELGALRIDADGLPSLTTIGWKLAKIPVEPRLARMLLAADKEGALRSALPIVSAMACDDPRRRPIDEAQKADQAHAPFRCPESDFAGTLKLWRWWEEQTKGASQSAARRLCKSTYLSYPKMREWRDLRAQLETLSKRLGLDVTGDTGGDVGLHKALLAGLLGRIGMKDPEKGDYRGARSIRFSVFPGSALFKKQPPWVMAGELVDTSRLYAREAAVLDPRWIEPVAGNLCKHSYHSPEWDATHGFVRATEQVTLYGLVIVPGRRCDYSRIDPATSRDLFIRHGLVDGAFPKAPPQVRANAQLIDAIRSKAEKLRKPDLLDEERLVAYFDGILPAGICSADALRKWLRLASARELDAFRLRPDDWMPSDLDAAAGFPDTVRIGQAKMHLTYRHSLDDEEDGITCTAKLADAAMLREWKADWLVPGALPEKLGWMIACLPSAQRRILSPTEDTVERLLTYLEPGREALDEAIRRVVAKEWGIRIAPDAWAKVRMPVHFLVRYRIRDEKGAVIAQGRDLEKVLAEAGVPAQQVATPSAAVEPAKDDPWSKSGLTTWSIPPLPESVNRGRAGWNIIHYPALHDDGKTASVRLYTDQAEAMASHAAGVARLFLLALGSQQIRSLSKMASWPMQAALFLKQIDYPAQRFTDDLLVSLATETFVTGQPPVRDADGFQARLRSRMGRLGINRADLSRLLFDIVTAAAQRNAEISLPSNLPEETLASAETQLAWLVFPGFVRFVPPSRLRHYGRHLEGMRIRLERARLNPAGDLAHEAQLKPFWERYREAVLKQKERHLDAAALAEYRWQVEEYRVSLFAQQLRTPMPVSPKRLDALWAKVVK